MNKNKIESSFLSFFFPKCYIFLRKNEKLCPGKHLYKEPPCNDLFLIAMLFVFPNYMYKVKVYKVEHCTKGNKLDCFTAIFLKDVPLYTLLLYTC